MKGTAPLSEVLFHFSFELKAGPRALSIVMAESELSAKLWKRKR